MTVGWAVGTVSQATVCSEVGEGHGPCDEQAAVPQREVGGWGLGAAPSCSLRVAGSVVGTQSVTSVALCASADDVI